MEHVSESSSILPNATTSEPMNVLVIDDQWTVGAAVAAELRRDGHAVSVVASSENILDEIEAIDPQVIVLHLQTGKRGAGEALTLVRRRFAHIHVIIYTSSTAESVRSQLSADLVLRAGSPAVFASQFRCWSRYV
jgi:CheY-like chemotaxis protein